MDAEDLPTAGFRKGLRSAVGSVAALRMIYARCAALPRMGIRMHLTKFLPPTSSILLRMPSDLIFGSLGIFLRTVLALRHDLPHRLRAFDADE